MKHYLFTFILGIFPGVIFSCSCAGPDYFYQGVVPDRPVVMVRVGEEIAPGFFEFEILDRILNEVSEESIVLQSSEGWDCRVSLEFLSRNDTLIFNLNLTSSTSLGDTLDYALSICGTQILRFQNGQVFGKIKEGIGSLPYSEFKNLIGEIGTPVEILGPELLATASPNPVENIFTLESQHEILEVLLYDLSGRSISIAPVARSENKMTFNISDLQSGIYLLKMSGLKSEECLKLVKS